MSLSHRMLNRIVVVVITILSNGCATQYGCKGMPDDPKCLSTTEAYQVTDKALPEPPKVPAAVQPTVSESKMSQPPQQQPVPAPETFPVAVVRLAAESGMD